MSPELNGNPPVLIRRKKNKDKKHSSTSKINEYKMSNYNYVPGNYSSFQNVPMNEYNIPFLNYPIPPEPVSLPIFSPAYPVPLNLNFNGNLYPKLTALHNENDYASLPVFNEDQNERSDQRRFSDPGLPNESDSSGGSVESSTVKKLTEQIKILTESNRQLTREVSEIRMEISILKQQQHSRHFERDYEPGVITDIIREIRDAARVREDALLAKVKHLVEEKQFSMGQIHLATEKNRQNDRLFKLEGQIKALSINNSRIEDNTSFSQAPLVDEGSGSTRQVFELEREALNLRRELQDARARKEESDQKILELDKKLSEYQRSKDSAPPSEISDECKVSISTTDTMSQSSMASQSSRRLTLSGPVTDL